MSKLRVQYYSGETDERELNKNQPLSIGKHASNDICIDDDDVATMHCRISWNRNRYEVAAANLDGVDVNGSLVRNGPLREGDVLRVGPADITIELDDDDRPKRTKLEDADRQTVGLAPADEASLPRRDDEDEEEGVEVRMPDELFEDDDHGAFDEAEEKELAKRPVLMRRSEFTKSETAPEPEGEAAEPGESVVTKLKETLKSRPVRPGEQDVIKSKLVLTLFGLSGVLLLASFVFWLMTARSVAQKAYDLAKQDLDEGKYAQAIQRFEEFQSKYPPTHPLAASVAFGLGHAKILKEIDGAAPNWAPGLKNLQQFALENRERPGYEEHVPKLREYAHKIALGAARSAGTTKDRSLLAVSDEARKLLDRFSVGDSEQGSGEELLTLIAEARRTAEAAIVKQETFDAAVKAIDAAVGEKKPMAALTVRRRLIGQYPDLAGHAKLTALLARILDTERGLVRRDEVNRDALTSERPTSSPRPLSLTFHTRSRTDEVSNGRSVFAVGKDCCYGIDTVTGDPLWRRVIGFDTPFFPIEVETTVSGLLLFDTRFGELTLIDRKTGHLVWRQPLAEEVSGSPLLHEGQVFLSTLGNHLYKISLNTGRISSRLTFSQPVLAPPALVADGKRLVVAGDREVLYTLSQRPLDCQRVSYLGQQAGSVSAPLLPLGNLLLMAENDRAQSCLLRLLNVREPDRQITETASTRIPGSVQDRPVVWSNRLFVPSSGERIAVFTISDDPNKKAITKVTSFQLENPKPVPMFLSPGSDDRLWLAGSALRKFRLKGNNLQLDPRITALGVTTQPLQRIGERFYVGRRVPYSTSVFFTQALRTDMTSDWRTILASRVLAWNATDDQTVVCVGEEGEIYRVAAKEILAGGFRQGVTSLLRLSKKLKDPLRAYPLEGGKLAVVVGNPKPGVSIVSSRGLVERQIKLKAALEANPIALSAGTVLPLPGRLKLRSRTGGPFVEDYEPPVTKQKPARWRFLLPIDKTQFLVLNDKNLLLKIQYRRSPRSHLARVARLQLDQPVDVPFVTAAGRLIFADRQARLHLLDVASLEPLKEIKLPAPATNALWAVGGRLYVETGHSKLTCFDPSAGLKRVWSLDLDHTGLAGPPLLIGKTVTIATNTGELFQADSKTGRLTGRADLRQPLVLGPRLIGGSIVVPTVDGSLYRVQFNRTGQQKPGTRQAAKTAAKQE